MYFDPLGAVLAVFILAALLVGIFAYILCFHGDWR